MTSKLTREQLIERTRENVKGLRMASRQHAFESVRSEILADLQAAEYALSCLESEPVAYLVCNGRLYQDRAHTDLSVARRSVLDRDDGSEVIPLYRHAQPTLAVPVVTAEDCPSFVQYKTQMVDEAWAVGYNACRAAMLQNVTLANEGDMQAGNSPVIPGAEQRIADAVELLKQASPAMLADNFVPEGPLVGRLKFPVIPDRWIPVSERMPDGDDFVYIWPRPDFGVELHVGQYCECSPKGDGWYAQVYEQNYGIEWYPITVTHWMPLPAAPQEVNHG